MLNPPKGGHSPASGQQGAPGSSPTPNQPRTSQGVDDETDVIGDLMGRFGKWQLIMTLLLSLFQVPNTFHIISAVYQSSPKDFWCKRPPQYDTLDVTEWRRISGGSVNNNCQIFDLDWSIPGIGNITTTPPPKLISCTAWEYNKEGPGETWTSEWDLVCDKDGLKNTAETLFLIGVAAGGIISGYLSDRFGRKKMLFTSAVCQTILGIALIFPRSFTLYLVLRTLLGFASVAVTYSGLILAIEYVDGKWRTIAGMYNLFPLPISYMMISGIAYLTKDFRKLQIVIGLPGLFLCFLWFVVPESPRWLLVKGHVAETKAIVEAAARMNKRELPANIEKLLTPPHVSSDNLSESQAGALHLLKSKYLRLITFCFLCIWFTINLVYYGIILNINTFGGDLYITSALAGLVEFFAIAIAMYTLLKVGKKWVFFSTLIATGIACACAACVEGNDNIIWLKITFVLIAKFTISAGNTIMPVYTAELYPTAIRNAGVGACNMAAGFALILTPNLSMLAKINVHLLMSLFAAFCIFGGIIITFLPKKLDMRANTSTATEERH